MTNSDPYKLWQLAKKKIPGGNMLISKRPEMHLPKLWPTYFDKTKGCFIWGLNGKKYIDVSLMGVGTNVLGYNNLFIDAQVQKAIKKGNMSTLNCPEEVQLANEMLKINHWAQMVKFSRSGGEANSISVRIARASTKKQHIIASGYHGWHDWYLASNLKNNQNLNNHLFPNVRSKGVINELKNTINMFKFNDFEDFKKVYLKNKNKIGIVKIEVSRNKEPNLNFLAKIRNFCNKNKLILIFDECTSGFREYYGGIHLKYKIYPDIVTYGKALGNGYAITAVVGKKKYMKNCEKSFVSSTFWSERIGFVAGLATLKEMKKKRSWVHVINLGIEIKEKWRQIFEKYNFDVAIDGMNSLPRFTFNNKYNSVFKTFITQEMLKKNILATNSIYISTSHTRKIMDFYFKNFENVISKLSKVKNTKPIKKILKTSVCGIIMKRFD